MKRQCFSASLLLLLLLSFPVISGCDYTTGVSTEGPTSNKQQQIVNISAVEAFDLIQENTDDPNFIIIDVRTPAEYADGHLAGAINIDYNSPDFKSEINKLERSAVYIVYCKIGIRSASASKIMAENGFSQILNVTGGYTEWVAEGLPVVK